MKTVNVSEARADLATLLEDAQEGPICLVRYGKPVVVIAGVRGTKLGALKERAAFISRAIARLRR